MLISEVHFSERGQANHTVLLSNISHIDHQASYTPDTLQYIKMMTPGPWTVSLYSQLNVYMLLIYGFWNVSLYAFSLLSVIFGLCFIRQHLMAYKPNCQETSDAYVYRPVMCGLLHVGL